MLVIPVQPVPSQIVGAQVGGQLCTVALYQKAYGLFADVYVSDTLIIGGVICQNLNKIVRSDYLGFTGDLCFYDTQGSKDPTYDSLGSRYVLLYLDPSDPTVAS